MVFLNYLFFFFFSLRYLVLCVISQFVEYIMQSMWDYRSSVASILVPQNSSCNG